ncbi:MAG TPA: glycosyltransferase [Pyrinomonadaceae bacterium]|nr:glycosyltransferase [Pyrinomonadaceae bacterium]
MKPLNILIANDGLDRRAGTEVYVRDLALGLLQRGHKPIAFSTVLGEVARELRAATVPVIDDLNLLAVQPDIIHGHHHLETMMALLHFPKTPAIHYCHGWTSWLDEPPHFPRILRYVAVDQTCRDRLVLRSGVSEERVRVLLNFVDMDRFQSRSPLPPRPKKALLFSNYASDETHLNIVREACSRGGLEFEVIGSGVGRPCAEPEKVLGQYDIVFAKARAALEAMAVGTAVVLCDATGMGPLVTTAELERLRALNFGVRALSQPLDADRLAMEIRRYDAADATEVSSRIRSDAGLETAVSELVELYDEVIAEYRAQNTIDDAGAAEGRAAAAYLGRLKAEIASHGAATIRMRERVRRIPVLGKLGVQLARLLAGSPGN